MFALQSIARGERIIEYTGERVDDAEIEVRYPEDMHALNHTFVFEVATDLNIDGGRNGNSSRWINHSCDPNCEAIDEEGRIFIVALRRIRPGEELNYDYNIDAGEPITPSVKRRWPCWCSASKCRGPCSSYWRSGIAGADCSLRRSATSIQLYASQAARST